MKSGSSEHDDLENNLLFKITLVDGTSQIIQIGEDQARSLGLQVQTENQIEKVPVISSNVETSIDSAHHNKTSDKIQDDKTSQFVYKIIKPEDLNLKPIVKTHLPRGRPRKRPNQKSNVDNGKVLEEAQKVVKQVRTRSGRITKPPKHIEKDFKKIDISDDVRNDLENDLKTIEFEPLTTNETPTEEPLQSLEQHSKKRNISSRFRCPTCDKAYLGRPRMMSHFHKHPDHGPLPKYCQLINDATWNFLILTSQKYKEGHKGAKFCQELDVLLQNARILAQYLFKPVENNETGYFINESLARIFGISVGNYNINETELNRDIALQDYLENSENGNIEVTENNHRVDNEINATGKYINVSAEKNNENCLRNDAPVSFNSFDEYMLDSNETHVSKIDFSCDNASNIQKDGINLSNINSQPSSHSNIEFPLPNSNHNIINKEPIKIECTNTFLTSTNSENTNSSNCLAVVKYEVQPKQGFLFNNHAYSDMNNDLHNTMDTNQLENLGNYHNCKEEPGFRIENQKTNNTSQHAPEKHNSHITLQNELHDVAELILLNDSELILANDTPHVSNMLDTSSNSDDIMNVDQLVNERFKKLTEADAYIQNNVLNIELPPLDIFHFDTS